MAKEKRTKPCFKCKESKVKCIYNGTLPCERCIKNGQAMNCHFALKLPSLKVPSIPLTPSPIPQSQIPATTTQQPHNIPQDVRRLPSLTPIQPMNGTIPLIPNPSTYMVPSSASFQQFNQQQDTAWKSQMENRMNAFDNKINELVDVLRLNQQFIMDNQQRMLNQYQQYQQPIIPPQKQNMYIGNGHPILMQAQPKQDFEISYNASKSSSPNEWDETTHPQQQSPHANGEANHKRKPSTSESKSNGHPHKQHKKDTNGDYPKDFRDGFLTKEEANDLFNFFDANISQQLFGFEISRFSMDSLWDNCPVLVCAICTIASIHHSSLSWKSKQLQVYLHELCSLLLFKGKPKDENEGFNTILALILCSFWLSDSQMFTGLALQLAKEYGLNDPNTENKDRLKLWYLLYVLDGQQSLTFNRQPLVNPRDYSIKHSKDILLSEKHRKLPSQKKRKLLKTKEPIATSISQETFSQSELEDMAKKQRFTDMRLVSQVEYNQALNEAFKGNAWDLLVPSSFGIPSRSNLELDKWMVSWTVLLAPGNYGAVWSTKSTLIYYNFAKMHINSSAVRQLQINPNDNNNTFPKWDSSLMQPNERNLKRTKSWNKSDTEDSDSDPRGVDTDNDQEEDDEEDDYDDDDFLSNKEFLSPDQAAINANIAVNAANTVLNLVINDNDILDNLRYVPVHIHIMLYYAALLLMNPPLKSNNKSVEYSPETYYKKLLANLKIVNILKKKIYMNLPIDTNFGNRLIKSLENLESEKVTLVKSFVSTLTDVEQQEEFDRLINAVLESSDSIEMIESDDGSSRGSTPRLEKISAWPGSNHCHPSMK